MNLSLFSNILVHSKVDCRLWPAAFPLYTTHFKQHTWCKKLSTPYKRKKSSLRQLTCQRFPSSNSAGVAYFYVKISPSILHGILFPIKTLRWDILVHNASKRTWPFSSYEVSNYIQTITQNTIRSWEIVLENSSIYILWLITLLKVRIFSLTGGYCDQEVPCSIIRAMRINMDSITLLAQSKSRLIFEYA